MRIPRSRKNAIWTLAIAALVAAVAAILFSSQKFVDHEAASTDAAAAASARPEFSTATSPLPSSPSSSAATTINNNTTNNTTAPKATKDDIARLATLNEILASRNDNDPRLDRDFNNLSEGAKTLFRERYHSLPVEKRNERGTIVFLLGRNLSTSADIGFLREIMQEPPCRSLADCQKEGGLPRNPEDLHHEAAEEVTLAYPQLVTLQMIERYLSLPVSKQDPLLARQLIGVIEAATHSETAIICDRGKELLRRFNQNQN